MLPSHHQPIPPLLPAPQRLHRLEIWITRGAEGKGGKAFIGDMTEEKSVELASKVASEGFVFTVGTRGAGIGAAAGAGIGAAAGF